VAKKAGIQDLEWTLLIKIAEFAAYVKKRSLPTGTLTINK
jgi:hypothetical protein